MTTAPTPPRADALIREHRASMHPETLRAWASDAVDELGRLQADNDRLRAERDDADRRAGRAERHIAHLNDSLRQAEAKAKRAELEARKPLPPAKET